MDMEVFQNSDQTAFMESPTRVFQMNLDVQDALSEGSYEEGFDSSEDEDESVIFTNNNSDSPNNVINEDNIDEGAVQDSMFISPNGTKTWFPHCDDKLKPVEGMIFKDLDSVLVFYRAYAFACGFTVRINQGKVKEGETISKYYRCNRSGKPQKGKKFDANSKVRQTSFKTTDCKANIYVVKIKGCSSYGLLKFEESHNHSLVEDFNKDLTKISRKLPFTTKEFIHKMSLNSIGPGKAHHLMVSMMGGHHLVNGTPNDFKNHARTTRIYIGARDTQLLLNKLRERARIRKEFYFDYETENGKLRSLFWADEISKINYKAFGEVLAFDATYQTNKYDMIFVPFTGVDNHKHCVTFGAGLLSNETQESYKWLLEKFLIAHEKQPRLVLTDQDRSMKKAIKEVFTLSKHRLCMWHIMKKLPSKVITSNKLHIEGDLLQNTDLRSRLHRLVWSVYMKTTTFENKWAELMEMFSLKDHEWLSIMYAKRKKWVPAYFRDIPMCGLLKTTSICESSNASFKVNSSSANTLIQFMLCFETRLENQRYRQRCADFKSSTLAYIPEKDVPIERHAFEVYTNRIFREVKNEISKGMYSSYIENTEVIDTKLLYSVSQRNQAGVVHTYKVTYDKTEKKADCACMSFNRIGYLCSHIFCVFRVNQVDEIPACYINKRWRKDVLPRNVYTIEGRYGIDNRPETILKQEIMQVMNECIEAFRCDQAGLLNLAEKVKELKENVLMSGSSTTEAENTNVAVVETILGQTVDVEVDVTNPNVARTKGCGRKRRISGPGEKAMQKPAKVPRFCKSCKKYVVGHDSRNCKKVTGGSNAQASEMDLPESEI
ncbi:hypothetical protein SSX86_031659 [Deinandra increscens subsp. villosa]|uniref:SWIM-type domain-containing protein n=1 Tax=Deinandra increscens subsp. villosa TaxID=3103831 RepID=A0AAP0C9H3_9ASTR